MSLSPGDGELLQIKGVCLLTPVLSLGVGGVGHRPCHHRAANALGNSVTQVPHRGSLAGKHSVASRESGEMRLSLRSDWPGSR